MLNSFRFLSRTNPQSIGYIVSCDRLYDSRRRGVCQWASVYQTYGDGEVQHSAETAFSRELLPDFLGSLAAHLAQAADADRAEMLEVLARVWPRFPHASKDKIRFALSLKAKEGKPYFYNLDECKTSTAPSKRHDKRWEEVRPECTWMNGSIQSAAGILRTGDCHDDFFTLAAFMLIMEVYAEDNDGRYPLNVWEHLKIPADWTQTAWDAVSAFVQSHRLKLSAIEEAKRWEEYRTPPAQAG